MISDIEMKKIIKRNYVDNIPYNIGWLIYQIIIAYAIFNIHTMYELFTSTIILFTSGVTFILYLFNKAQNLASFFIKYKVQNYSHRAFVFMLFCIVCRLYFSFFLNINLEIIQGKQVLTNISYIAKNPTVDNFKILGVQRRFECYLYDNKEEICEVEGFNGKKIYVANTDKAVSGAEIKDIPEPNAKKIIKVDWKGEFCEPALAFYFFVILLLEALLINRAIKILRKAK